jgi:hypothetical protein
MNGEDMKRMNALKPVAGWLVGLAIAALGSGWATAAPVVKAKEARLTKHAERGVTCVQCHGKATKKEAVPMAQCLGCHGETKDLAARTAKVKPTNPHENRHFGTEADCNRCHHEHAKSENLCLDCHLRFGFKVP